MFSFMLKMINPLFKSQPPGHQPTAHKGCDPTKVFA